jgi:hypothetical protein
VSANGADINSPYFHGKKGGSANAIVVNHTHSYSGYDKGAAPTLTSTQEGSHTHEVTFYASPAGIGD